MVVSKNLFFDMCTVRKLNYPFFNDYFKDFILEQNHLDVVLYKIASAALDKKINIFGVEKMAIEIELLKKERKKMIESCHEEETKENSECMLLELQGLELTNYIRKIKKQKKF